MDIVNSRQRKLQAVLAALTGLVSGAISAVLVDPVTQYVEEFGPLQDTLVGLLSMFALSAGLAYGIIGAVFGVWRMGFGWRPAAVWFFASIIGMGAAFYVAILVYTNSSDSFVLPYFAASPVGALVLGGGIVALRPYRAKLKLLGALMLAPTAWALGVGLALGSSPDDYAITVPWLTALFSGWQTIFLVTLAVWRRD